MVSHTLQGLSFGVLASLATAQQCPPGYAPGTGLPTSTGKPSGVATSTTSSASGRPTPIQNSTVVWQNCPTDDQPTLQCAIIEVPLDWTDPGGDLLELPIVRLPASSPNARNLSIITNPGGPGVSGIASLAGGNGQDQANQTNNEFHIVSFDPRGVGLTRLYTCPGLSQNDTSTDDPDFSVPDYVPPDEFFPDTDAWFENIYENNAAESDRCADPTYKEAGELVGTAFVARDVNAIAQALGEDGLIRYWGYSYGTLLGSTISAMFPEKIDLVVLDGNINPTDYYRGLGAEAVASFDDALKHFFTACAEAGPDDCVLSKGGASGEQLLNAYKEFYDALRQRKITTTVSDTPVTYKNVLDKVSNTLFEGKSKYAELIPLIAEAVLNAQNASSNDKRQSPNAPLFDPTSVPKDEGFATLTAITCGDVAIDFGAVNGDTFKYYQKVYQEYSKYGYETLISILQACSTWELRAREVFQGQFKDIKTRNPILFVNGPFDPVTPLVSAKNASSGFVGSAVLRHNGTGHCSDRDPSTEVKQKVGSYFLTGKIPDVSTVAQPDTPAFPSLGGSAKKRSPEEEHRAAEAHAKDLAIREAEKRREYPAMIAHLKRDIYDVLLERDAKAEEMKKRDAAKPLASSSVPPYCTPIASGKPTGSVATLPAGVPTNSGYPNTYWGDVPVLPLPTTTPKDPAQPWSDYGYTIQTATTVYVSGKPFVATAPVQIITVTVSGKPVISLVPVPGPNGAPPGAVVVPGVTTIYGGQPVAPSGVPNAPPPPPGSPVASGFGSSSVGGSSPVAPATGVPVVATPSPSVKPFTGAASQVGLSGVLVTVLTVIGGLMMIL